MIIYCTTVSMKNNIIEQEFAKFLNGNTGSNIQEYIDDSFVENLSIYYNNVTENLISALTQTYQYTKILIGEECFNQIAMLYVAETPATSGNLDDYGASFDKFIQQKLAKQIPYIKDITKVEWSLQLSAYEVDNNLDNGLLLSKNELEDIKFSLHPAIYYFRSNYPIYNIWKLLTGESTEGINYKAAGQNICIVKEGCRSLVTNISNQEYAFIDNINKKKHLLDILNIIGNQEEFERILIKFMNYIIPHSLTEEPL